MAEKLLSRAEVLERTGLGRTTQWVMEKEGRFPRRRQLGTGRVAWLESEVDEFLRRLPVAGEGPEDGPDLAA